MKKKKAAIKTVQSKFVAPKILKPAFSPNSKKTDLAAKDSSNSQYARIRPLTSLTSLKKPFTPTIENNSGRKSQISFPHLPPLQSATKELADSLFLKKVKLCFQMCDFSNDSNELIETKENILTELATSLSDTNFILSDTKPIYQSIFTLISAHIYKTPKEIPEIWFSTSDYYMLTDEYHPNNFRHINIIYDIAMALFSRTSFNYDIALELSGDLFKLCIFLCRTIDDCEQLKLAELISIIYSRIKPLRHFFMKIIKSTIIRVIYEKEPFTSIKPILISLASIVAGFSSAKKLSKSKLSLFYDCILPIHHSEYFQYFSNELATVTAQFLEKDHSLVIPLYQELVLHWPHLNSQKQQTFIDEIALFASYVDESMIEAALKIIIPQLMTSMKSCHAQISIKVMSMWEVNDFVWMIVMKSEISYPLILPSLYEVCSTYWLADNRLLAAAVLNTLNLNNKIMFQAVGANLKKIQNAYIMKDLEKGSQWHKLIQTFEKSKKKRKVQMSILSSLYIGCDAFVSNENNT